MNIENFLEFKGRKLTLITSDGQFNVALKPICEALEIDWSNELRRVKAHPLLGSVMVNITTTGSDNKSYTMVCIPEKYIYGWLMTLSPRTKELLTFQLECYELLYRHFHNILATRYNHIQQRTMLREQYSELHTRKLEEDPEYRRLITMRDEIKKAGQELTRLDAQLLTGQGALPLE